MSPGLLIVNGDDWGLRPAVTDAIRECFAAGAVTSVTAMVYMADSERAAAIAREESIPAGLHLNLSTPLSSSAAPADVVARQHRVASYLRGRPASRWLYNPTVRRALARCIEDQWDEFVRLYGDRPTHVDGHEHFHMRPDVVFSPALRSTERLRPGHTFLPSERSAAKRAARWLSNWAIRTRFATPRWFFSLRDLHPELGGRGLEQKLELARRSTVEVMAHAHQPDERAVLLSDEWRSLLATLPVGSYSELDVEVAGGARRP